MFWKIGESVIKISHEFYIKKKMLKVKKSLERKKDGDAD